MAIKPITNKQVVVSTNINRAKQVSTRNLSAGGGNGTNGQYLQSTATGIQWATLTVDATSIQNGN